MPWLNGEKEVGNLKRGVEQFKKMRMELFEKYYIWVYMLQSIVYLVIRSKPAVIYNFKCFIESRYEHFTIQTA